MKQSTEQLLDCLLEDAAPPDFRAALLDKTLRRARRRRQARHFAAALSVAAVAGVFLLSIWKMRAPAPMPGQRPQQNPMVVNSRPLRPDEIVLTRPGSALEFASSSATFAEVRTSASSGQYREIDDKQLMALLSDKQAYLIHHGPDRAELVFPDSGN